MSIPQLSIEQQMDRIIHNFIREKIKKHINEAVAKATEEVRKNIEQDALALAVQIASQFRITHGEMNDYITISIRKP